MRKVDKEGQEMRKVNKKGQEMRKVESTRKVRK